MQRENLEKIRGEAKMSLTSYTLNATESPKGLAVLSQSELLLKREEIDRLLTETHIKDINLSKELLIQLKKAKLLQQDTDNNEVPANQRAQVQNSLGSVLINLAKHQQATYTAERYKRMETALIKTLKTLPKAAQKQFFDLYIAEADIELS